MTTARRALLCSVLVLTCGCGQAPPARLFAPATSVAVLRPAGVQDPAQLPAQTADPGSCDPRASFRPAAAAQPGPTLDRIRQRGVLRVGVTQTDLLMSYVHAVTGEVLGFEVDIARHLARVLLGDASRVQFITLTIMEREPAVQDGRADLVFGAMTMTCDRWTRVAFSAEYLASGQRVLVPRRSPVTSLHQLGGKKVCATIGSTSISAIARAPARPRPVGALTHTDCMMLLQQGEVAAISTDGVILAGLAQQDQNVHIVGPKFTDEPVGIAVNLTQTDLVRAVNGVLEQLRTSRELDRLYQKWLEPSLGPATAPEPRYRD